ncbi:MAG: class I SAM-dependent methyltransferase [Beijerinckiaceae bacterium]
MLGLFRSGAKIPLLKPFPHPMAGLPDGWLNETEAAVLYNAVALTEGPVLDMGSWIGRSTCAMAQAIRDGAKDRPFDVLDFGIAGDAEWRRRFNVDPATMPDGDRILKVIRAHGGTCGSLKQNLVDRGLEAHVRSLFFGDADHFISRGDYAVVFCDATHDRAEIDRSIPIVKRHLAAEDFLLICDDIIREEDAALIADMVGAQARWMSRPFDKKSKFLACAKGRYTALLSAGS